MRFSAKPFLAMFAAALTASLAFLGDASAQCPGGVCPAGRQAPAAFRSAVSTRVVTRSTASASTGARKHRARNLIHRLFRHGS